MTTSSVHEIRRELASTAFRLLGDASSHFAIDHLPELIEDDKDLNDLRIAIASLAVRGGLTDAESSDVTLMSSSANSQSESKGLRGYLVRNARTW